MKKKSPKMSSFLDFVLKYNYLFFAKNIKFCFFVI